MAVPLFTSKVIAVIWDFDQTLIPGYQQEPLFAHYGIDPLTFWRENNALVEFYGRQGVPVSRDTTYLNHLLNYVRDGRMASLTNRTLREFGAGDVWGCEFIETPAKPGFLEQADENPPEEAEVSQIGYVIDNTTKTRAIWEINKGCHVDPDIDVNALIAQADRRVPLRNMLYIADGPSDIPVFSILEQYGGRTLGVHNPASDEHFTQVKRLQDQGRVQHFVEADYRPGTAAYRWVLETLKEMAEKIVEDRDRAFADRVRPPSGHVT